MFALLKIILHVLFMTPEKPSFEGGYVIDDPDVLYSATVCKEVSGVQFRPRDVSTVSNTIKRALIKDYRPLFPDVILLGWYQDEPEWPDSPNPVLVRLIDMGEIERDGLPYTDVALDEILGTQVPDAACVSGFEDNGARFRFVWGYDVEKVLEKKCGVAEERCVMIDTEWFVERERFG